MAKKQAVKKPEPKKTEIVAVQAAAQKETIKKEVPKKETPKKETPKKAVRKSPKTSVFIQYGGQEEEIAGIEKKVKDIWVSMGRKVAEITAMNIYVKPEEGAVYYVINDDVSGKLDW